MAVEQNSIVVHYQREITDDLSLRGEDGRIAGLPCPKNVYIISDDSLKKGECVVARKRYQASIFQVNKTHRCYNSLDLNLKKGIFDIV